MAAFIGTTAESLIGATAEQQLGWLTHDLVNIINTTIGALSAIALDVAFDIFWGISR
jgi:uncharacterized membrane protein